MSKKIGNCFEKSLKILLSPRNCGGIPGWVLAHGIVTGTGGAVKGKRYGHGWIETDELVYDAQSEKMFPREYFYQAGQVEDVIRYTRGEAFAMGCETEHCGPWEDRFFSGELMG